MPIPGRATDSFIPIVIDDSLAAQDPLVETAPLVTGELRASKTSDEVLREAAKRKATRQRLSAAGLTLLMVACGVALYFLANPQKLVVATGKATELEAHNSPDVPSDPVARVEAAQAEAAQAEAAQGTAETAEQNVKPASEEAQPAGGLDRQVAPVETSAPIVWEELRTVSRRDLEKLWAEVHPYIFRLVARRATGERKLSGVLVDSRGWVVTSLSAVEGASSIEVWPAPADPLAELAGENLRDEIRGVLAVDRARDLVLLQINRRLVNVVTALRPTDQLLVPGKTLLQAAAIGPERLPWLTEARIARSDPAALPAEIKQAIERRGFDLAPYWPGHQRPLSQGVGAALFTPTGELGGVNTGLSAGGVHFFAEAKWVQALQQAAREPAVPLSNLGQLGLANQPAAAADSGSASAPPAPGATKVDPAGDSPFAAGHEAEPVSRQLAQTAHACAEFGWLPEAASEPQRVLSAGLVAWREARGLVRSRKLFPEDSAKLSRQLAHWTGQLKATILSLDRDRSAEFNRRAWDSLGDDAAEPRALFVRVVLQPGTSPRVAGADTATLEVIGLERFVVATVEADIAPLLPDSEWLVVLALDPKEETTVSPAAGQAVAGQPTKARRGTELREISEVKSIGLKLETPPAEAGEDGK